MKYTLDQILDVTLLQTLQDKLNVIIPFPSALIDNSGKILTATAWQDICTKFHRIHPESEKECIISDQYIQSHMHEADPSVTCRCPHGMVDNAVPIVIEGHHLASFFTGQLFLEPPDPDFFRKQAARYGFDEESYMEAVKKVPVWNMEQLHHYLDFIKTFTESMANMGLIRLREIETNRLAGENELRFRTIIENTQAGYFFIDKDGIIRDVNDSWVSLYKYNSREEVIGHHFTEIQRVDDTGRAIEFVNRILAGDPACFSGEFNRKCKDDSTGYHTFSAKPVLREGEVIGIEGFIIDNTSQRLAEMDRDITRTRLTSVFDKMIEGFALHEIICDDNGIPVDYRFLDINPAFEKMTCLAAHEIIGRTSREVFNGLEPHWIERYGQVALTGEPDTYVNFSAELKKHYRIMAFSNEKGQFATIFDDITERVAAENELRESEAKYRQLSDLTPEGILIHVDGIITYANNSAAWILGASEPEMLVGKKLMNFVHADFQSIVKDLIGRITEHQNQVPIIEEKLVRLNGEVFFSEVAAVPFKLAGRKAVQVVFNDITQRKLAEEKMRTLAHAIDCTNECVSMTDADDTIIFVNKAFCNTYGYSRDELMGRNIIMVRSPAEPRNKTSEILDDTLRGGWSGEVMNRRKDGTDFPVHLSTAIVTDSNDQPVALIGIATDITERKKNEEELIAAKERAVESDRLKSAFLANISHEIRTPMNSILGFSELLEDMVDDPRQLEYLRIISNGGERLLNIINSVIDIAKIEAGQENLSSIEFDINPLMNELFELNKRRNTRVEFINDMVSPQPLNLFTDKTKLFQILNNLLSNALKFTKQGTVRFGYSKSSDNITFYVKDTGLGIPAEFKKKVFDRFRKVDLHDRTDIEGTGLGLAITKELVKMLKGEIWFDSEPGEGTTFFVRLPSPLSPG
ncbi:MAG: PAS domain S-box protein [Porphyromonadaceae bacterium]|nr:MAG: PAS domain S-box protein [Porphyromonadaceae bacterium]